jgi:F0F1-type ATP synthase membrane subunit b/b'
LRFNFIINSCIKYSFIQPITTIIEERKEYILTNLGKASEIAEIKLTTQYEELANVRREAKFTHSKSEHKDKLIY